MPYFHVFIRETGQDELRLFMRDMSDADVRNRVLRPYRKSGSLVADGEIIPIASIRQFKIVKSETTFSSRYSQYFGVHMRKQKEMQSKLPPGGIFISPGPREHDLISLMDDTTEEFLRDEEPGTGARPGIWAKLTENATLSAIVAGVVVLLLTLYFSPKP